MENVEGPLARRSRDFAAGCVARAGLRGAPGNEKVDPRGPRRAWESWQAEQAKRFFQLVTMRDGKIIDIQGYTSRRDAPKHLGEH